MKNILLIFSLVFLASQFEANAQIPIPTIPFDYTQNFNSLGSNDVAWVNNNTLQGWYSVFSTNGAGTIVTPLLDSDDGNGSSAFARNYGQNGSLDRALGSLNGIAGPFDFDMFYGARFTNTTPFNIDNISISYTGEQWRQGNAMPQTLRFFYRLDGGTNFLANNTGWTSLNLLDFVSPKTGASTALNGNALSNKQTVSANSAIFPNPIIIAPNQEFWIRWAHNDSIVPGHGLAIDDVSITFNTNTPFVPNPNPDPTNTIPVSFNDIQLNLKKPKLTKTLRFNGVSGFPFKAHILSTISTPIRASYIAFATGNQPTNLVFIEAGKFKPITNPKSKLAKQGVKAVAKHKGNANKPGKVIANDTASVTLIVKVDGTQGTNTGTALFTNTFTSKVQ